MTTRARSRSTGTGAASRSTPGLYAYEFDRRRDYVLSRDAHNAVVVAGRRSDWNEPARLVSTRRDRRMFEATIDVRAYAPITHRRRVVFSRRLGYLLVEDRLDAPRARRETFTQLWHLAEGSSPIVAGPTVRTRREHGNVVIRQLIPVDSTRIVNGREQPAPGLGLPALSTSSGRPRSSRHAIDGGSARFLTLIDPGHALQVPRARRRREGDAGRRDPQGDGGSGERAHHDDEGPHEDRNRHAEARPTRRGGRRRGSPAGRPVSPGPRHGSGRSRSGSAGGSGSLTGSRTGSVARPGGAAG